MQTHYKTVGIVGGSGMLGRALSTAFVRRNAVAVENFWLANRSGKAVKIGRHTVQATPDTQALANVCDVIVLCVPPAAAQDLIVQAPKALIISVMAGVSITQLKTLTGSNRIVRAMSSPAASQGLAYSPWVASDSVTDTDRTWVRQLFTACGATDEIQDEAHIDHFTAMTGPVPGFVAYFAQTMVDYAVDAGIAPDVADRAIRQLFLASGTMMAQDGPSPAAFVKEMIDYNGTTAAGLVAMQRSQITQSIADGLDAAVEKTRRISHD